MAKWKVKIITKKGLKNIEIICDNYLKASNYIDDITWSEHIKPKEKRDDEIYSIRLTKVAEK